MKKITLIAFVLGCMSFSATAQQAVDNHLVNRNDVMNVLKKKAQQAQTMHKLLKLDYASTEIITEKPEGAEVAGLNRSSTSFFNFDNSYIEGMKLYSSKWEVGSYIEGDDGCYYIYNPFGIMPTQSYLKLEQGEGDTLVAHTPQAIYELNDTYYATRLVIAKDSTGFLGYFLDPQAEEGKGLDVKYVFDKDGTLRQVSDGYNNSYPNMPNSILALTDKDGNFFCYGDGDMVMSPMNETATVLPEDAEIKDYILKYFRADSLTYFQKVKMGFTDGAVYLRNPYEADSMMWIRGDVDGNKVTFPKQYIGIDSTSSDAFYPHHAFFVPYDYVFEGYDEMTFEPIYDYTLKDQLVFDYDNLSGTLSLTDGQGFMFNLDKDSVNNLSSYDNPYIFEFKEVPATPSDPIITFYGPYSEQSACGVVTAYIATEDVDGNYILPEKLYYNVYFDDSTEPFVFTPSSYINLTSDMTDVPYGFDDGYDFMSKGSSNTFYFYQPAEKNVGVQAVYKGGGEVRRSNIYWMSNEAAGINQTLENSRIVATEYYDLQGRRVQAPATGLYVKKQVYDNGKVVIRKILE
ncbi:MAG: hypothetical protein ACOYJG_09570 [Prevotella sp.]|jgi:hypothetical protein